MLQSNFQLEIENDGKKEKIKVVLQQISPLTVMNIASANRSPKTGMPLLGDSIKDFVEYGLIVSPKNIIKRIDESDNPLDAYKTLYDECDSFCTAPKKYVMLHREGKNNAGAVGDSNKEHDVHGNEETE